MAQSSSKPNIVVIWGDDIGITNLSCYSDGLMGYRTPNIDRIANEEMRFTDYYGEQSCTAGRASFITGQHGLRTGLNKVGLPAAPFGLSRLDPTIVELLKPLGYVFFFQAEDGIRDGHVTGSDVCSSDLRHRPAPRGPGRATAHRSPPSAAKLPQRSARPQPLPAAPGARPPGVDRCGR